MEKQNLPNATAVLVLGICSVVLGCFFVGIICGIIGIVLSMPGRKLYRQDPTVYEGWGSLNAGFIMSIVGVCLWGLVYLYYIIIVGSIASLYSGLH
jgi:hypothetical protein